MTRLRMFCLMMVLCPVMRHAAGQEDLSVVVRYQEAMAERVRSVAEMVLPSIVTIEVVGVTQGDGEVRQDAPTSGVIVDSDGHVLTSSLVTRGSAASILVVLPNGDRAPAKVVGRDEHRELVLLKIDPANQSLVVAPLSEPSPLTIGQTMVAVARYGQSGEPLISTGVLSAIDRLDGTAIQTDARVSPAFYGGPLLDLSGKVCGILIPAVAEGGGEDSTGWYDSGVAFAIPTDIVIAKLDRLRGGETIRQGLLGVIISGSDPYARGTKLSAVRTRSPAQKAGLQVGDEILSVGGRQVRRRQELKLALGRFDAGDEIEVISRRDGKEISSTIGLVETIPPVQPQVLGVTLTAVSDQENSWEVTRVLSDGAAEGLLHVKDVVISMNDQPIDDLAGLRQRLWTLEAQESVKLAIKRDDKSLEPEIQPRDWAGAIDPAILDIPSLDQPSDPWRILPLKLTDVPNAAQLWCPPEENPDDAPESERIGLIVVLLPPGQRDAEAALAPWKPIAAQQRIAVLAIASEMEERWQISEIDAVAKLASAAIKQASIDPAVVAITGPAILDKSTEPGPADSMALAVALSAENVFSGVALSAKTQPPAVQLKPDDPLRLIRVLFPIQNDEELPAWSATLTRLGCPLQTIESIDHESLLRWVASLRWL